MEKKKAWEFFGTLPQVPEIKMKNAGRCIKAGLVNFFGEGYIRNDAQEDVADWLSDNKRKGLLLMGDYGTGKTVLATRIILPLVKWYMETFYRYEEFRMYCYSAYDMRKAFEQNFSVCVDDVGVENFENDYGRVTDYYSRLLDNAEKKGLLLICTTNLDGDALNEKYGQRTFDRMNSLMRPVVFQGRSLRR